MNLRLEVIDLVVSISKLNRLLLQLLLTLL
jgi:hypothetical protein